MPAGISDSLYTYALEHAYLHCFGWCSLHSKKTAVHERNIILMTAEIPKSCPACGAEVPPGAHACPHCGSDENTGWSENAYLANLGIYTEDDYQETIEREFGGGERNLKQLLTWIAALLMLLIFFKVFIIHC